GHERDQRARPDGEQLAHLRNRGRRRWCDSRATPRGPGSQRDTEVQVLTCRRSASLRRLAALALPAAACFWAPLAAADPEASARQVQTDPSFLLTATGKDLNTYFPTYLANGYVSTMTAPRGTESNLSYLVAFMDYTREDIARPAAIPGWSGINY